MAHLRDGIGPTRGAAERTTASLMPIIFTAGLSVAAAAAGLVVAQLGFFRAFGPGLAVTVLIALAVVLTFVPAVMALFGERLLWPGAAAAGDGEGERSLRARSRLALQRLRRARERD